MNIDPLTDEEILYLDCFLLERLPDDDNIGDEQDVGIFCVSELDGFLTAIVSGPEAIMPSTWLSAVWGDFEHVWESPKEMETIFSLMVRHMNDIVSYLMESPDEFEPLFLERSLEDGTVMIVDEWCEGYLRGLALSATVSDLEDDELTEMLSPVLGFTQASGWANHEFEYVEVVALQQAIAPSVRKVHEYWLSRRKEHETPNQSFHRESPKIGRNDPCFCGSGKKFKKCCLH
jgi:uncharacterized protein